MQGAKKQQDAMSSEGHRGSAEEMLAGANEADGAKDLPESKWKALLSPLQYAVLRQKVTDPPRWEPFERQDGDYFCAACGALLYKATFKFDSGCGWPAFFSNVSKAVRAIPDVDGHRTEILCNACNSHLGHVFKGEGFKNPNSNLRHCVNSTSLRFVASAVKPK